MVTNTFFWRGHICLLLMVMFLSGIGQTSCVFDKRLYVEDALVNIRKIREGQSKYFSRFGRYASLEELANEELVAKGLADGKEQKYSFVLNVVESGYTLEACPDADVGSCFFMDETGVIRASFNWKVRADKTSEAIRKQ